MANMWNKTRGIVLHAIPYNDKYAIIYMYTEAFGRAAYLVSRSRRKQGGVSKALFAPLTVWEMEVDHQPKRDIHRIKEAHACFPLTDVATDPVKSMLALFLSEVLFRVLKETEPDPRLFHYLYDSIQLLEALDQGIANFHLVFLLGLLQPLGIFPNVDAYEPDHCFDLLNGEFVDAPPFHRHFLSPAETVVFVRLLRIRFENMALFGFSRHERMAILQSILAYYRLHVPDFPEIKSLAVLQSVFD